MALKLALLSSGRTQREVARELGISESYFSKFVRGWEQPSEQQRKAIARALKAKPDQLFAEVA